MARQKGLFKITGTLGDVNFYVIRGIGYACKAGGGFNGKAIRTQSNMQRVRENASEFGQCSQVKKHFRLALMPFLEGFKTPKLHARMMSLFMSIKRLDNISDRGKRRVSAGLKTAKGRHLLTHFAFTPQHPMLDAIKMHSAFEWDTQRLLINGIKPKDFKAPKAATHVGITLGVMDFDFDSLKHVLMVSPIRFLEVNTDTTSFELFPEHVMAPEHTGIAVLGVRFYEVIENEVYGLDTMVGLSLLDVN
ncbi:hypothetical protein GCM10022271_19740 [Corallibacter vietnamensis]|uniref:Uncharacterized protein n=1 Tax=Corallibacter vietnamensis TaxID=904130 RepID=A0ABP7HB23_9FLAO